jgi:hypothetical protein
MADLGYETYLASVAPENAAPWRRDGATPLKPSRLVLVPYALRFLAAKPLGPRLNELLCGGTLPTVSTEAPMLSPAYHDPDEVSRLRGEIQKAYESGTVFLQDKYLRGVELVLQMLDHATEHREAIVCVLKPTCGGNSGGPPEAWFDGWEALLKATEQTSMSSRDDSR